MRLLKDRAAAVKLRVLRARSIPESLGQPLFPVASSIRSVDLPGMHCNVVNPDVVILDDIAFFKFDVDPLLSFVRLWWIESKDPGAKLAHSSVRADSLPYNGGGGLPLFIAEGTECSEPPPWGGGGGAPHRAVVAASEVACPVCEEEWLPGAMRQHMCFHIMHEPSKTTAKYPCGFCGGESAQFSPDVSQLTGCAVWLDPKGQPKMHCKLVGDVKYSIASAAKCAKSSPCTDRPLRCSLCPQKPAAVVHCKLNIPAHWHIDSARNKARAVVEIYRILLNRGRYRWLTPL